VNEIMGENSDADQLHGGAEEHQPEQPADDAGANEHFIWNLLQCSIVLLCLNISINLL
jgi:hypothetical protein